MRRRCLFIFIMVAGAAGLGQAETDELFSQGVEAVRAGEFPAAAEKFQLFIAHRPASGALVDLGLAEWQRGHAGPAILAWEQALWIDPFDASAKANLEFARSVAQVDAPQLKWFEAVSTWLPPVAWVWVAGTSLWLVAAALVLPRVFRRKMSGWQQSVAALGLGVFLFSLAANLGMVGRAQIGFVLGKNTPLRLTPTHEGEDVSTLNAGDPARRLRVRGEYCLIRTANGTGWVERGEVGLVNPE